MLGKRNFGMRVDIFKANEIQSLPAKTCNLKAQKAELERDTAIDPQNSCPNPA